MAELSPAVTPPPGNPRFPAADGLRALAVLGVLGFHVAGVSGAIADGFKGELLFRLGTGLYLFFLLSGFLLYRPFLAGRARGRGTPSTREFARRRVLRIVPAYWFALTVLAAISLIEGPFTSDWWIYYGFLQNLTTVQTHMGIGPAWSLGAEAQFYILLPVWALVAAKLPRRGLLRTELVVIVVLGVASEIVRVMAIEGDAAYEIGRTLPGTFCFFALGMVLAVLSVAAEENGTPGLLVRFSRAQPIACWVAAGVAYLALAAVSETADVPAREYVLLLLQSAVVVLIAMPALIGDGGGDGLPQRLLRTRPFAWIGLISYGIYLWHAPIVAWLSGDPRHVPPGGPTVDVRALWPAHGTLVLLVSTFAVSVFAGWFSYRVVELPFLRRKERRPRAAGGEK